MFINDIELPNPVLFTCSQAYIAQQNQVLGGLHITKQLRTPTEGGTAYAQKRALIRLQFEDLTIGDKILMDNAWSTLIYEYCTLQLTGLSMDLVVYPGGGDILTDAAWVTVAPNATCNYELYQGTAKGINGLWEGPYLMKTMWALITGDMRYSTV